MNSQSHSSSPLLPIPSHCTSWAASPAAMGVRKATCVAHLSSGGWMKELNSSLLSLVLNVLVTLVFTVFVSESTVSSPWWHFCSSHSCDVGSLSMCWLQDIKLSSRALKINASSSPRCDLSVHWGSTSSPLKNHTCSWSDAQNHRMAWAIESHRLRGDPVAPGQVPSELHPATRGDLSSILASKPRRTTSPFQCDVPANNNQLVFWRNHQKRVVFFFLSGFK